MSIQKGKLKKQQPIIITDDEWHDILLIGQLPLNIEKSKLNITDKTDACVFFDDSYFGLDLFQIITYRDIESFKKYQLKLKLNGIQHLLIKINSVRDKYKIAYFNNASENQN